MLCSWDAEEYELLGSVEYVEVYSIFSPIIYVRMSFTCSSNVGIFFQ